MGRQARRLGSGRRSGGVAARRSVDPRVVLDHPLPGVGIRGGGDHVPPMLSQVLRGPGGRSVSRRARSRRSSTRGRSFTAPPRRRLGPGGSDRLLAARR